MQFRLRRRRLRFIAENCQQVKVGKLLLLSLHEKKLLKVTKSYFSIYYIKVHSNAMRESLEATSEEEKSISLPTRTTARVVPTINGLHKPIRRIVRTTVAVVLTITGYHR